MSSIPNTEVLRTSLSEPNAMLPSTSNQQGGQSASVVQPNGAVAPEIMPSTSAAARRCNDAPAQEDLHGLFCNRLNRF